jgi:hypothetical protein
MTADSGRPRRRECTRRCRFPRGRERLAEQPEAAADERRGHAPGAERADVRIVRPCRNLSECIRRRERQKETVLRPVRALWIAHAAQSRPVEGDEARPPADRDVQGGDVGIADERLGVLADDGVVEEWHDLGRAVPAAEHLDGIDRGIDEERLEVARSDLRVAGNVVVPLVDAGAELHAVAAGLPPTDAPVDVGALVVRARRCRDADRPAGAKRQGPHGHARPSRRPFAVPGTAGVRDKSVSEVITGDLQVFSDAPA